MTARAAVTPAAAIFPISLAPLAPLSFASLWEGERNKGLGREQGEEAEDLFVYQTMENCRIVSLALAPGGSVRVFLSPTNFPLAHIVVYQRFFWTRSLSGPTCTHFLPLLPTN